jgi:two-component system cell cycle response regulator CpdR
VAPFLTILVVEDDRPVRDVLIRVLSEHGFAVPTASDGYDAVRILMDRHVDVLFTDIILPGMDGVQLAKQAKLMRPGIKVLFQTGYANLATTRDAIRHGRVLYKPLRAVEIVQEAVKTLAA